MWVAGLLGDSPAFWAALPHPCLPRLGSLSWLLFRSRRLLRPSLPPCPQVCDKYGVTLFYTAPTAIRTLMACGDQHVTKHK